MYKLNTFKGEAAHEIVRRKAPLGLGKDIPALERVELWCTSFADSINFGDDFTEFRCWDAAGHSLGIYRVRGY